FWIIWKKSSLNIQVLIRDSQWIHVRPWVALGDFNCVRRSSERISSSPPDISAMKAFNDALYSAGLEELTTHGCPFTWTNKQDGIDRKWMRLDRAVVNALWQSAFPASVADVPTAGMSDHSPVLVYVWPPDDSRPNQFRFLNCWAQYGRFLPLVKEVWREPVYGCPMYRLVSHLKSLKARLKQLHGESYSSISARINRLTSQLKMCQERIQIDPVNHSLLDEEKGICQNLCKLKNAELSTAYQREKVQDVKMGDASTSYFFAKVTARRSICHIAKVKDMLGTECTSFETISEAFITYYSQLLGSATEGQDFDASIMRTGPILTAEDCSQLTRAISDGEIREALFAIDINKSPGPDGYTSGFFKAGWDIVQTDFIKAVRGFFETGRMLKQINSTIVTLVPKGRDPSSVLDYRPISCCTTIYKTISKILTTRLEAVLSKVVG
ncbi:hypothetical protein RND81_12G101300, partial [Saponaria officinalis]